MRTTVLFDLGDVLVRLAFGRGLGRMRELAGPQAPASAEEVLRLFGPESVACNLGRLSAADFVSAVAAKLGLQRHAEPAVREAWCDVFEPWPQMESLASEVLEGHPAILVSNTDPLHWGFELARIPVLSRLTGRFLSFEEGLMKPDPRFLATALERFALHPGHCAYVDDRPENVAAARELGIPSHRHDGDVGAVRAFLRGRGVRVRG